MLVNKGNHWISVTGDVTVHIMPVIFANLAVGETFTKIDLRQAYLQL